MDVLEDLLAASKKAPNPNLRKHLLSFRASEEDRETIQAAAHVLAGDNISLLLRYAVLDFIRRHAREALISQISAAER